MERLTSWCEEIEEAFLSCEKCKKNGTTECWSQENCTQTAVDRLAEIEDILGNEYDLDRLKQLLDACKGLEPNEIEESKVLIATQKDHEKMARLRELVEADREGRCVVLNTGYTETAGGKALEQAMYLCSVTNNEVARYTADAIAEKFIREERFFEAMKERENDDRA